MNYPTMTFRDFIRKYAFQTSDGQFFCWLCGMWINKQRWTHFKKEHRYKKAKENERSVQRERL